MSGLYDSVVPKKDPVIVSSSVSSIVDLAAGYLVRIYLIKNKIPAY